MKRLISIVLVAVALFTLFAGCGAKNESQSSSMTSNASNETSAPGNSTNEELPVLRVAILPFLNYIPVQYMIENELDAKYGFEIETVLFSSGPPMNEALAADLWDVGVIAAPAVYSLTTYGAYLIADIQNAGPGGEIFVRPDSPIAQATTEGTPAGVLGDAETVRGASILVPIAGVSHFNALKWLEMIGLTVDDVELVNMDYGSAYQAFLAGEGDAVALIAPTSYKAREQGWINVGGLEKIQVSQYDSIVASKDAYENKHDLLVNYMKAWFEAVDALRADPEMTCSMLSAWCIENGTELSDSDIAQQVEERYFFTAEEEKTIEIGATLSMMAEFFADIGNLDETLLPKFYANIRDDVVREAIGF